MKVSHMVELTDEQFREARRQIVERLTAMADIAVVNAQGSLASAATNFQNPIPPFAEQYLVRSRAFYRAADVVKQMERDGYVWAYKDDE